MKNFISIALFCSLLMAANVSQAQITLGFRAGVNLSDYRFSFGSGTGIPDPNTTKIPLLNLGIPVEIGLSKLFAVQAELNFIQKGFKVRNEIVIQTTSTVSDNQLTVNWIELPILAKVKFGDPQDFSGGIFIGPSFGFGISGNTSVTTTTTQSGKSTTTTDNKTLSFKDDKHSQFDFGLNFGGDVQYKSVFLDLRYQLGLTNMITEASASSDISAKTRGISITLGYRMPFGSSPKMASKAPTKTPVQKKKS
jgi:hypothetical protein